MAELVDFLIEGLKERHDGGNPPTVQEIVDEFLDPYNNLTDERLTEKEHVYALALLFATTLVRLVNN